MSARLAHIGPKGVAAYDTVSQRKVILGDHHESIAKTAVIPDEILYLGAYFPSTTKNKNVKTTLKGQWHEFM